MVAQLAFEHKFGLSDCGRYIIIPCTSYDQAEKKSIREKELWARWAYQLRCRSARFVYGKKRNEYLCVLAEMAEDNPMREFSSIVNPMIHVGSMGVTPGILSGLNTIASNPDERWFMHKLSPDLRRMTQIAVSDRAADLIVGTTVQQAIGRDRSDYTPPEDLADLTLAIRRQLTVGDRDSILDHRFRIFSPVTKENYRLVRYQYRLIEELPTGELIQIGQCLDVEPIPTPVLR